MKKGKAKIDKADPSKGGISKIKRYFFWCLLIIVPLVLMELLSFTYIKLASGKGTYRERIKPVDSPYHPYLGYVHTPNFTFNITKRAISNKMSIQTDENGYSITPAFSYKDPDITIIVTGGSTIFGVGSSDNSTTVPSIIERIINQRLDLRAEVVNMAMRGANSFQEMLLVNRYFAENRADLVLAISGVNDVGNRSLVTTVEDRFLGRHVWYNAVPLVQRAERGDLILINLVHKLRSISYTFDLLYRQIKSDSRATQGDTLVLAGPLELNIRRDAPIDLKQQAKITATHYAAVDQMSKMNAADFIMILQPSLFNKKKWSAEEANQIKKRKWDDETIKTRRQAQDKYYEAYRKSEKPFQFIDLSGIFAESNETLYIDHVHYNDLAAEKFAEKIFESIQPMLQQISRR
jgi:lysophospholipase L1-like esterase